MVPEDAGSRILVSDGFVLSGSEFEADSLIPLIRMTKSLIHIDPSADLPELVERANLSDAKCRSACAAVRLQLWGWVQILSTMPVGVCLWKGFMNPS